MPDTKITALTELAAVPATNDVFPVVDVSDTSMAASGTDKRIQFGNLGMVLKAGDTMTGALAIQPSGTAASAGDLRLRNTGWIAARNSGNTANINMFRVTQTNSFIELGGRLFRDDLTSNPGAFGDQTNFIGLRRNVVNPANSQINIQAWRLNSRGLVNVSQRANAHAITIEDNDNVGRFAISSITQANPAVITTTVPHTIQAGDSCAVYGVTGMTGINKVVIAVSVGASTITTDYDSSVQPAFGGTAYIVNAPMMYGIGVAAYLKASRGLIPAGHPGLYGEDVASFVTINASTSPFKATEAFYLGRSASVFSSTGDYEWGGGYSCAAYTELWGFGGGSGRIGANGAFFDASRITYDTGGTWMKMPKNIYSLFVDADGSSNPKNFAKYDSANGRIEFGDVIYTVGGDRIQVERDQGVSSVSSTGYHTNGVSGGGRFAVRGARGTLAVPLRTETSDVLGYFGGAGASAVDDTTTATMGTAPRSYMRMVATEDWTATAQGAGIIFVTTPNTSTTATERVTIGPGNTMTLADASVFTVTLGTTNGVKIGSSSSEKLGFWGLGTPIARPAAYTQTFATADKTHAARTAVTLTDNTAGSANTTLEALTSGSVYATDVAAIRNNFADLAAAVNAIIVDLADTAQFANAVVDDLQAVGLAG